MSTELGAGRRDTLLPIWKGAAIMSAVEAALVTLVFLFLGRRIAAIFIGDPAVVSSAAALLVVAGVFQVFDGSQVVSSSALRGMSDVKIPAALTFASYWIVAVPVGYVLGFRAGLGAVGIWWGLALGLAVASVVLGYRFVRLARAPS
jgi:MATE family multidrug resistance protein